MLSLIAALMMAPPYMVGTVFGGDENPPQVQGVREKQSGKVVCRIAVADGGGFGKVDVSGCKALGKFATAVKITGTYRLQEYQDAAGAVVATGSQKEDGYWIYLPDGRSFYIGAP